MKRVKGVTVTPHYCPIQDKDAAWYKQFKVIVMGLDSIEARRWLNAMACSLVEYETLASGERKPDLTCAQRALPPRFLPPPCPSHARTYTQPLPVPAVATGAARICAQHGLSLIHI